MYLSWKLFINKSLMQICNEALSFSFVKQFLLVPFTISCNWRVFLKWHLKTVCTSMFQLTELISKPPFAASENCTKTHWFNWVHLQSFYYYYFNNCRVQPLRWSCYFKKLDHSFACFWINGNNKHQIQFNINLCQ